MTRLSWIRVIGISAIFGLVASPAWTDTRSWGGGTHVVLIADDLIGELDTYPAALMPWLAAQRPINRTLWIRGEVGYRASNTTHFHSTLVPLGIGFRWSDSARNGFGAYLEFYPSLFGYHLDADHFSRRNASAPGPLQIDRVVPGLMTGFGLSFQANRSISITYGIRIHRSAEIEEDLGFLNHAGFQIGFDWRPPFEE